MVSLVGAVVVTREQVLRKDKAVREEALDVRVVVLWMVYCAGRVVMHREVLGRGESNCTYL